MTAEPNIAVPAHALGDIARSRMAMALLGNRQIPASELARIAGVAASTASEHLHVLLAAGVVTVTQRGRNRFYQLADGHVAQAIEALQVIAPPVPVRSLRQSRSTKQLTAGRTCYDHLAGDLGLRITTLLIRTGTIPDLEPGRAYEPAQPFPDGPIAQAFNLRPPQGRRPWVRGCLDWTGRRPHIAGQAGADVLTTLTAQGWLTHHHGERSVELTPLGTAHLHDLENTAETS